MSETLKPPTCGKCGAALSGYAPDGLCAACLLDSAFEERDVQFGDPAKPAPLFAFKDYELLEEIARGGMGVVYRARQISLNRPVAIKMILGGHLANAAEMQRFRVEAETAAQLQHPNIVAIHEVGEHAGQPFFSMDFVAGRSLAQLVHDGPLTARKAATYLKTIAEAVQYAHSCSVLHRDLKPSNILIDDADQPRVTDFGLAKRLDDPQLSPTDSQLTQTGQVLGSPSFIPPEQAAGQRDKIGPASDVYSLGAMLYHCLTARPPFVAETMTATLRMVAENEAVSPRLLNPSVPRDLETICLKCLQKDSQRRYATARELAEDLNRFLCDEPIHARPVRQAERVWRWCRRNRALAATGAAVVLLVLAVAIGSSIAALRINHERQKAEANAKAEQRERQRAEVNAGKAEQAANLEAEQRARAEKLVEENRWSLYAAHVKVAEEAIKEGDILRARKLLDSLRPKPGEVDLRGFDWYYLWQQYHSEELSLPGGPRTGRNLAFSPDGRWLAAAAYDGVIRICDLSNGVERLRLTGHTGWVHHIAFAPGAGVLGSTGEDGTVRLWDVATGKQSKLFQFGKNSFAVLAFSMDGKRLAAGEGTRISSGGNPSERFTPQKRAGKVIIWDLESSQVTRVVEEHTSGVLDLAFHPNGSRLVSSGIDGTVALINCDSGSVLATRTNAPALAFGLAFMPGGREIAEASWVPHLEAGEINLLDSETLRERRKVMPKAGKILSLAISPDGSRIAGAGADCVVRIWNAVTGAEQGVLAGHSDPIQALAFAPDGNSLASAGADAIKLWRLDGHSVRQRIRTQNSFSVAFSPDGKLLACGGRNIEIREAASGSLIHSLGAPTNFDVNVTFTPDGRYLRATSWGGGSSSFWKTADWSLYQPPGTDFIYGGLFRSSPNARSVATSEDGESVHFWDMSSGTHLDAITNLTEAPDFLGFVSDGTFLAGGAHWLFLDVSSKQVKQKLPGIPGLTRLSNDGRWLANCQYQGLVSLYSLPEGKFRSRLSGHRDRTWEYSFSHDSRLIATASWDGTVKLWHLLSGQELLNIPSMAGVVWSVAFAPDDRTLAFACGRNAPETGEVVLLHAAPKEITDSPSQMLEMGRALAREGRWGEASSVFGHAISLQPDDLACSHYLAIITALDGDIPGYRKFCQKFQSLSEQTGIVSEAVRAAKTCLLLPDPQLDFRIINQWVEVANVPDSNRTRQGAYANLIAGLAAYRQNNYAAALSRMDLVIGNSNSLPSLKVTACMARAMAYHALREFDTARSALAAGLELERTTLPKPESGDLGVTWDDWIVAHVLVGEARAVIEGQGARSYKLPN